MRNTVLSAVLCIIVFLCGCAERTVDVFLISSDLNVPDGFLRLDEKEIKDYFDVDVSDASDYTVLISESSISADELAIFRAKDNESKKRLISALENRIENQRKIFEGYMPEESAKLRGVTVKTDGLCIYYAIGKAAEILK